MYCTHKIIYVLCTQYMSMEVIYNISITYRWMKANVNLTLWIISQQAQTHMYVDKFTDLYKHWQYRVTNAEQLLSAYQMPYYGGVIFFVKKNYSWTLVDNTAQELKCKNVSNNVHCSWVCSFSFQKPRYFLPLHFHTLQNKAQMCIGSIFE